MLNNRKSVFLFIVLLGIATTAFSAHQVSLVPQPNNIDYKKGSFYFSPGVKLLANGNAAVQSAKLFNSWLTSALGYALPIVSVVNKKDRVIAFSILPADSTEKYHLTVKKNAIVLEAGPAGLVRGSSTLLQLIFHAAAHRNKLPCLVIHDEPIFAYRGVHLDVCRHFFSKEFVKRYIDLLALHKMNTFHWHLTEDQGWRIEIKKYPKLTSVGAWRNGSMVGPYRDQKFDSLRYGGFYTQEDIKEVVAYAAQRQITIIPEIEMPGHAMAALAAYPEYSCTGSVKEVAKAWGVFEDVFCVKDSTFTFLEDILTEVIDLFPSKYIHIGGDECPKERWKVCPNCLETRYANNLRDEHELQSYFIQRIEKFLNSKGRQIIGWDEILEGGLAPNATVMSWRGNEGGKAAARASHKAIMTPGSHCYFDHYQGERAAEPLAFGGYTPLEKVYAFRPLPDSLSQEESKFIIGAQANLWTEYMYDEKQVEYMLFPRLCALSEVLWTDTMLHDENKFYIKVLKHQKLLDCFHVNYSKTWMRPALQIAGGAEIPSLKLSLKSKFPQATATAWTSAADTTKFAAYKKPLVITSTGTLLVRSTMDDITQIVSYPFEVTKSAGAKVALNPPGDRNYANPGSTLTDGITGVYPWTGKHWVGWIGKDVVVQLNLGKMQTVDSIVVVYLHDPTSWIHAPRRITCSNDSTGFASEVTPGKTAVDRVTVRVGREMQYFSLFIQSIGKNPVGTAGAGEDGWMFISEILVY